MNNKQDYDYAGAVEVVCPKCGRTEIVYIPKEEIPTCPDDKVVMVIREYLREGKMI